VLQTNFEASYPAAGFELVHIDTDNLSAASLHQHWDVHNPTFPVLTGCGSLYSQYGNGYVPYNVVLDPDGVVRYSASGFNEAAIHAVIQQHLVLPHPFLELEDVEIFQDGDGDGRPDPGETVDLRIRLRNSEVAQSASSLVVTFSSDDPDLAEGLTSATYGTLAPGQSTGADLAFSFSVQEGTVPHWADLHFQIQAEYAGGTWSQTLVHVQRIARPPLLLVDSDGTADDNETFVQTALVNLGREFDLWTPELDGAFSAAEALAYDQILWLGGLRNPDINSTERTALHAFLDRGGLLLLSSQYASSDPNNLPLIARCGADVAATAPGTLFLALPPVGDPWFGDMQIVATGSQAANNNVQPDNLALRAGAHLLATWDQGARAVAATYVADGTRNAVFCGWPVEAMRVHSSRPLSVPVQGLLQRLFQFHADNPFTPLSPVTDLAATVTPGGLLLSWSAVPGVASYRVYQQDGPWLDSGVAVRETGDTQVLLPFDAEDGCYHVRCVR
jgi:hypothetical protein